MQNSLGTYKVRNEIETKRNEINENETKSTKTKRNQRNENETNESKTKSKKTKRNTMLDYFPHMSQCIIRRGQDLITIEQE